jgi:adenylosuccinate synthase
MPLHIVIGAQWGDEGKGRILDALASQAAIVARYSGGDNAGHTVSANGKIFRLHLIPSGIVHPEPLCIMGSGMVINPQRLLEERAQLQSLGVIVNPERLKISHAAQLITPMHTAIDRAEESKRVKKIGTTGRGIGPAYTEKAARRGLRAELLTRPDECAQAVKNHITRGNETLQKIYDQEPLDADAIAQTFGDYARELKDYIAETSGIVDAALRANQTVLAEGAQGALLDIDYGTYPYVTSSYTGVAGALAGLGVGPGWIDRVIGVVKAFQTRVGEGPFPTEELGEMVNRLRGDGSQPWDEYGTTTGRPRRCGWLDLVLLRYAARINGLTELVITKLDILSGLASVPLCTAYAHQGKTYRTLPMGLSTLDAYTPLYDGMPGWEENICNSRNKNELPEAARQYIRKIEQEVGIPVSIVSVGSEREQWLPWGK